jgi:UDP-N-acetylglucosamine--N-acetylmuramyl-(pentapeptide) pyrophosphoryl-undecaprenol N-acetylglucosamine transferase
MTSVILGLRRLFRQLRPALVVGTGGYASGPACAFALLARVPVALQEQNAHPGLTTRWLSRWARQVHLGFPEAARQLRPGPHTQVFALGNPIRVPPTVSDRALARQDFGLSAGATVLLVVGGSQGARAVNGALLGALERVARGELSRPAGLEILWATGPGQFEAVRAQLEQLPRLDWVHTRGYIDDMPRALAAADVALSRAGAMATAELLAAGVPMVLVPLPTAAADHQTFNARALEAAGAAISILESGLTPELLWEQLEKLVGNPERREVMSAAARGRAHPDAAREIAAHLLQLVQP